MSRLTKLASTRQGVAQPAVGSVWTLARLAGTSDYRQRLYWRLAHHGASGIVIGAATALRGHVDGLEFDCLAGAEAATINQAAPTRLVVTLPTVRRLRRLRLAPAPAGAQQVEFYRLDGERQADEPTVVLPLNGGLATLTGDRFVDRRFALQLASGQPMPASSLVELTAAAPPTNVRLGLAPADADEPPLELWRAPGESLAATGLDFAVGPALAEAAERLLEQLLPTTAPTLDLMLVLAADAPCRLRLDECLLDGWLVSEALAGGAAKQTIVLDGAQPRLTELPIRLPGRARIGAASLAVSEQSRGGRLAGKGAQLTPLAGVAIERGLNLLPGRQAAQRLQLPTQPSLGCLIDLLPLLAGTELQAELRGDWQGQPAGPPLAQGRLKLSEWGRPLRLRLDFERPVGLVDEPNWLLVTVGSGAAVIGCRDGDGARLLEPGVQPGTWRDRLGTTVLRLAAELVGALPAGQPAPEGGPAPANGGPARLTTRLTIGERVIGEPLDSTGRSTYNLAAALTDWLAEGAQAGEVVVPLRLMAAGAGTITVYPPRIEYQLDEEPASPV
jgi:hypothetical protein